MPEIVAQMTSTTHHPTTTSTTIGQLTRGLRAETNPGIPEKENSRILQQTTIQSTTELIIEPKTVSIYQISTELSTTTSESTKQSKTELSTRSTAETNTEPIIESSKIAPEGTESKIELAKLITETTAESTIKMTDYTQRSNTESTANESVSSTETAQHLPETTDGSTTKSSEPSARSIDKSTKEATESTTQTNVDFKTETPTATTVSTTDSISKEENQYNVEEGITTSTIRTTEGNMIINRVTGKEYFLGRTIELSVGSTGDSYQHLSIASISGLTTENNKVTSSGPTTQTSSDEINDEVSQTENEYDFPYIDPA